MKIKCSLDIDGKSIKEEIIDIDTNQIIGMEGFAPNNYLYNQACKWAEKHTYIYFEIVEGYPEQEIPYQDKPFKLD